MPKGRKTTFTRNNMTDLNKNVAFDLGWKVVPKIGTYWDKSIMF